MSKELTTKEDIKVVAKDSETTVNTKPVERRRKRDFGNRGPLGNIPEIPGYQIRWILVDHSDKPERFMQVCINDDYEPVTPQEIGLKNIDGTPVEGTTVIRSNKGNGKMMLVKKPLEFYEQDVRENTKRNLAKLNASTKSTKEDGTNLLDGQMTLK